LAPTETWGFAGFLMLYMLTVVCSVKAEKHTPDITGPRLLFLGVRDRRG
jgi:hypothetical protein